MTIFQAVAVLNEKAHRNSHEWAVDLSAEGGARAVDNGDEAPFSDLTEYEAVAVAQRLTMRMVHWEPTPILYRKRGGDGGEGPSDDAIGLALSAIELGDLTLLEDKESMQVLDAALTELLQWRKDHLPPEIRWYRVNPDLDRATTPEQLARLVMHPEAVPLIIALRENPSVPDHHEWLTKERGISDTFIYAALEWGHISREDPPATRTSPLRLYEIPEAFAYADGVGTFLVDKSGEYPDIAEALQLMVEAGTDAVQHEYLTEQHNVSEDTITKMLFAGYIERVGGVE